MTNPLDGLRVIDLSGEKGALCGRVLADLGADVILVEPPGGSPARAAPPLAPDGTSLSFAFRNAGKRGITLDIRTPEGRADLHRVLDTADVWIESHAPGALAQHGLDPAAVLAAHPSLVLTSITDFGQTGPHCGYLGTDLIGYAMGGMLYRAGAAQRPPVVAPGQQAYDTAAVTAACATMAALLQRRQTGYGQWLDISVQEATSNLADWSVPLYSVMGFYSHREGAGMYPVYRCADGWVRLIIIGLKHWRALRAWMGEPPELQDPTYDDFLQRVFGRQTIEPVVQRFFASVEQGGRGTRGAGARHSGHAGAAARRGHRQRTHSRPRHVRRHGPGIRPTGAHAIGLLRMERGAARAAPRGAAHR